MLKVKIKMAERKKFFFFNLIGKGFFLIGRGGRHGDGNGS